MKRRAFLAGMITGAGLASVSYYAYRASGLFNAGGPSLKDFADLFADPQRARVIGEMYIDQHPGETARELIHELLGGDPSRAFSPRRLRAFLWRSIREDFDTERILELDGWALSQTEARVYALCYVEGAAEAAASS